MALKKKYPNNWKHDGTEIQFAKPEEFGGGGGVGGGMGGSHQVSGQI